MDIFNIDNDKEKTIEESLDILKIKGFNIEDETFKLEYERDYYLDLLNQVVNKLGKKLVVFDSQVFEINEDIKVFNSTEQLDEGYHLGKIALHDFGLGDVVSIIIEGKYYELHYFSIVS